MQQYNQMLPSHRSLQTNLSSNVRLLPGGGMIHGMNNSRNMPTSRPGFQGGLGPSSSMPMMNSGSMMGMANPVNMHSGPGPAQGSSMLRPREALNMMRVSESSTIYMLREISIFIVPLGFC